MAAPGPKAPDRENWLTFVEQGEINGIGKELAMNMIPGGVEEGCLKMLLDADARHLFSDARLEKIQRAFSMFCGDAELRLQVEITEIAAGDIETPSRQKQRITEEVQQAAEKTFEQDPNVQHLINLFDAEIVDGSVRPPSD